jgi:stress-induced morphogen
MRFIVKCDTKHLNKQLPESALMAIKAEIIENQLKKSFPQAAISLKDMLGDADHYGLHIVCSSFEGCNRVQRHQMIYKALGPVVGNELHALSIKALTPQEAEPKEQIQHQEKDPLHD